ncbi:hypothetical protein FACS1894122_07860 [Alphaproteobacteria bacterium]|nr:hypothetical protein FACS1894122_07860 [Alphaproteobacteria bacterium]
MKKVLAGQASTHADTASASKIKSAYTKEARDSISACGATTDSISARGATTDSISACGATTDSISARGAATDSINACIADTDPNAFSYISTRRKSEVIVTYIMQRTYTTQAEIDAIMPCIIDGKEYRIQTSKDSDGIRITAIYRTILDDIVDTIAEETSHLPESKLKARVPELARKYTVEEKIRYTQLFLPSDQKPAFIEKLIADFESQKYKPKVIASTDTTGMNFERQRSSWMWKS